MEKDLIYSELYEVYKKLLTDNQSEVFNLYYLCDLSLGEISENLGITRQGVRDSLVKAEKILINMESKLGIMKKNESLSEIVMKIQNFVDDSNMGSEFKNRISELTNQINNLI